MLWRNFTKEISNLSNLGITAAWLPPPFKGGTGGASVGYDVYDLFDLGEFDQKGTAATKYGTKEEFIKAIQKAHKKNIQIICACRNLRVNGAVIIKCNYNSDYCPYQCNYTNFINF